MIELNLGGTMANIPSETMLNEYRKIYCAIKNNYPDEELSCFFPLCGSSYFDSSIRLMIVGRCTNGWDKFDSINEKSFYDTAKKKIMSEKGFQWLLDDGKAKETYIKKTTDKNGNVIEKECRYNINRSAFFRVIRKILKTLKPESAKDSRWFEHFVWTNLYPLSPLEGGNADDKMKATELEFSKKILSEQISYYRPTHIVFITDYDYWFSDFKDEFPDINADFQGENGYVVGKGTIDGIKAVITVRPDRTRPNKPNEENFAKEVVENLM